MTQPFDFDSALKQLQSGKPLVGQKGILTPLIKHVAEATLQAELNFIWGITVTEAPNHCFVTN